MVSAPFVDCEVLMPAPRFQRGNVGIREDFVRCSARTLADDRCRLLHASTGRCAAQALARGPVPRADVIGRPAREAAAGSCSLPRGSGARRSEGRRGRPDGAKGFRVDDLRDLVAGAMEPILKPLVYRSRSTSSHAIASAASRCVVSATLPEIVEEIARGSASTARSGRPARSWTASTRPLAPRRARRREGGCCP
jgi:hypothetical protein